MNWAKIGLKNDRFLPFFGPQILLLLYDVNLLQLYDMVEKMKDKINQVDGLVSVKPAARKSILM